MERSIFGMSLFNLIAVAGISLAVLFAGGSRVSAEVETSGNFTYVSQYIWRGWDLAPDSEPALQGGISVAHPSGVSLDVWGSYAIDDDSQLDELDYTIGYATMISDTAELSFGYTLYTFPSLTEGGGAAQSESREAFAGLAFPDVFLGPSLTLYHDWEDGDGTYIFLGLGYDVEFTESGAPPLCLSLGAGYNSGQWGSATTTGRDEKGISDIDLGASMTFTAGSVDITPSLNYIITPMDEINDDNEFFVGLDFGFSL